MKLDGAIFAIEPRSVGGCIDLAVVFLREHFCAVLKLLAWFALPSLAITWWLVDRRDWTLSGCLLLFMLECPFFGAALVVAAGRRVFGDRFSTRDALRAIGRRLPLFFFLTLIIRTFTLGASLVFLVPGFLLATRYGFLAEVLFLERCSRKRYEARLSDLLNQSFQSLFGRLITIVAFFGIVVMSLFMLVDLASGTLFGLPILSGRISDLSYAAIEVTTLMSRDPRVATALVLVMWLVYPITRLAWMFCYFDLRILQEAWDIELTFRVEAQRLESAS